MKLQNLLFAFTVSFFFSLLSRGEIKAAHADSSSGNAKQFMQSRSVYFLENRGQMMDTEGKPVPFVLFKAEVPGMNMYVTEKGFTYVFIKMEEDKEADNARADLQGGKESLQKREEKINMEWNRVDMNLQDASIKRENIVRGKSSVTDFNFFYAHCSKGVYGVKEYEKITIKEIYPGIDWVFYSSSEDGFKYDFIVHPGADPAQIRMVYSSLKPVRLDPTGNIFIETGMGALTENAPYSYLKESKQQIQSKYKCLSTEKNSHGGYNVTIGFDLPTLNFKFETLNPPFVIDPVLNWATFYGGNSIDGPMSIANDGTGNVFITGYVGSSDFPVQSSGGAYYQGTMGVSTDVFILKYSNAGLRLWATYYGGNGDDWSGSIVCDGSGNVFVTGYTVSTDFPVQNLGGAYYQGTIASSSSQDIFILKFTNAGVRLWATYYGGNNTDMGNSITCDGSGNIFVTGATGSTDFPVQNLAGAFYQGTHAGSYGIYDAFILKFTNAGVRLWATYYGGSAGEEGYSIACDGSGNVLLTGYTESSDFPVQNPGGSAYYQGTFGGGYDAFILKFTNAGLRLWATYYGGNYGDWGHSAACDGSGNVFVMGRTSSTNFPVLNPGGGAYYQGSIAGNDDVFILKFNNAGVRFWATHYGGSGGELCYTYDNIALNPCGEVYISFVSGSAATPTQSSACAGGYFDSFFNGGSTDIFITRFSNTGALQWATYFGGDAYDFREALTVDNSGNLFIAGEWANVISEATYPLTNPGGGTYYDATFNTGDDGCIAKFLPCAFSVAATSTDPLCSGQCTGTAAANPIGGTSPFTYIWGTLPAQSAQTITGLCTGTYSIMITDACGITATATVTITQPPVLTATATASSSACSGNNGNATITAGGGTGGYTYNWNPTGQTTQTATGLATGTYTATVSDASGCVQTQTVAVTTLNTLSVSAVSTQTGCTVNNGSATANPGNGTTPYTYNWSNGQTTQTTTGLAAGTYTVTVTDANGCTQTQTVSVTNANGPNATMSQTDILCNGQCNGTAAAAAVTGGNQPYTYSWINGQTTSGISGLCAGSYTLTVADAGGCTATQVITIIQPAMVLSAGTTSTPASCGSNNGSATVTAAGGSAPYTYNWSTVPVQTSSAITGLSTGTYTALVTDANGCTKTATVITTQTGGPTLAISITPQTCTQGGTATATASGGSLPYTYQWCNGQTASIATGLSAGSCTVIVTDASGCSTASTVTITSSGNIPSVSATSTPASCGSNNGMATATVSGGTSPYAYQWSSGQTASTATGLSAGTYTITITDASGCTQTQAVSVAQTPGPAAAVTATAINISPGGSSQLTATGGGTYSWSPATGLSCTTCANPTVTPLWGAGGLTYCVFVADGNGCTDSACIKINVEIPCGNLYVPNAFSPNEDGENDIFFVHGNCITELTCIIYNRWGEKIFKITNQKIGWDGTYKGKLLDTAVFVYYLEATLTTGEEIIKKGNISLVR
ncbi:MAG: T9SS type B sorting domain-containing protein [Bacteroidetes bacterium]|nr:MAG: T9SS type B sorting domain-containing protein [Bacteroidota bacterium]